MTNYPRWSISVRAESVEAQERALVLRQAQDEREGGNGHSGFLRCAGKDDDPRQTIQEKPVGRVAKTAGLLPDTLKGLVRHRICIE